MNRESVGLPESTVLASNFYQEEANRGH